MSNYCKFCRNASVDPELSIFDDFNYFSVGEEHEGFGLSIRTGGNKPTVLVFGKYDDSYPIDIGKNEFIYKMNYCPECGRKLIENIDFTECSLTEQEKAEKL